ncbi:Bax inhibitor-1 family protein [Candidatus Dependentiae bacterium]
MQFPESPYPQEASPSSFMYKVYGWMSLALAITAAVAYYVFKNPNIYAFVKGSPYWLLLLFLLQLGLVIVISFYIMRMSLPLAIALFIVYAISVGITFSFLFEIYTQASIYATFLVTSLMFLATGLYGYFTKSDLTSFGSFGFMALIGLIVGGLVNMFLQNTTFDYILSAFGVLVFTLLTAYDTQKLKEIGRRFMGDPQAKRKVAVLGALTLYLDFINLFLYLLRFCGRRQD